MRLISSSMLLNSSPPFPAHHPLTPLIVVWTTCRPYAHLHQRPSALRWRSCSYKGKGLGNVKLHGGCREGARKVQGRCMVGAGKIQGRCTCTACPSAPNSNASRSTACTSRKPSGPMSGWLPPLALPLLDLRDPLRLDGRRSALLRCQMPCLVSVGLGTTVNVFSIPGADWPRLWEAWGC